MTASRYKQPWVEGSCDGRQIVLTLSLAMRCFSQSHWGSPAVKYRPVGRLCNDTQKAWPPGKLGSMQGFTSAMSFSATLHGVLPHHATLKRQAFAWVTLHTFHTSQLHDRGQHRDASLSGTP